MITSWEALGSAIAGTASGLASTSVKLGSQNDERHVPFFAAKKSQESRNLSAPHESRKKGWTKGSQMSCNHYCPQEWLSRLCFSKKLIFGKIGPP